MSQYQYESPPKPQEYSDVSEDDPLADLRAEDGSYSWGYAVDLHKDHFMLEVTFIAIGISFLLILGTLLFATAGSGFDLQNAAIVMLCFLVIGLIGLGSWWLVCTMYGWLYGMIFRMDEEGITMRQVSDQAEKSRMISRAVALTGALTHNIGTMAAGAAGAQSTDVRSVFRKVTGVSGNRLRNRITLRTFLSFNMIYADDEHYDAVFDYIARRCPNARITDS